MEDITVERIKERIRENVRRARERYSFEVHGTEEKQASSFTHYVSFKSGTSHGTLQHMINRIDSLLWKYGLRYAKTIKRIPVLKNTAERLYWKLVNK